MQATPASSLDRSLYRLGVSVISLEIVYAR
jgi:hypothetical protein